ncbi:TPA: hypothetical protein IAA91_00490 [Candidatus Avacholeplasma faecigallinarum]|nr:hypothetical protein [Candidatus Avacholeplasma faecigallinarum]
MQKIKNYKTILISIILISISMIFISSCKVAEDKLYQSVTLEVFYPITSERIEENKTYKFEYDGTPKVFTAKVKLDETGKYLEDKDFEDNDWQSHIRMLVRTKDDAAYKDYRIVDGEEVVYDWTNVADWPIDFGVYEIQFEFNNHGPLDKIKNSTKYIKTWFYFTIEIL